MNSLDLEPKKTILRESELQLNLLAGNLPAVLFKAATRWVDRLRQSKKDRVHRKTLVDLQQKGWIDLIHPDDFDVIANAQAASALAIKQSTKVF